MRLGALPLPSAATRVGVLRVAGLLQCCTWQAWLMGGPGVREHSCRGTGACVCGPSAPVPGVCFVLCILLHPPPGHDPGVGSNSEGMTAGVTALSQGLPKACWYTKRGDGVYDMIARLDELQARLHKTAQHDKRPGSALQSASLLQRHANGRAMQLAGGHRRKCNTAHPPPASQRHACNLAHVDAHARLYNVQRPPAPGH